MSKEDADLAERNRELEHILTAIVNYIEGRHGMWVSHGGARLQSPHSHLTVEGEIEVILDHVRRLADRQ